MSDRERKEVEKERQEKEEKERCIYIHIYIYFFPTPLPLFLPLWWLKLPYSRVLLCHTTGSLLRLLFLTELEGYNHLPHSVNIHGSKM